MTPVGLTKDAGWQVGASRTYPVALEEAWDTLLARRDLWFGGETGEVRSLRPYDRMRLSWGDAILQLVVRPGATGTSVRLHAERLRDADEREAVRARFKQALDGLTAVLRA